MNLFFLLFSINIFSEKFILKIKNGDSTEFKNLTLYFSPLNKNVEIEKDKIFLDILKPQEEKEIILNYNFKNPSDDKLFLTIKDENNSIIYQNIYDLKYKNKPDKFKFYFSKNSFNFYFPKDGIFKMNIFDVSGRKVYSVKEKVRKGEYKKDLSFLKSGLYFYRIDFDKKYKGKFLIIKGEK
jgi:hypothetical protein